MTKKTTKRAAKESTTTGRPATYGAKMEKYFSVRVNAEQVTALNAALEKRTSPAAAFMREAALKRAGLGNLGVGFARIAETGCTFLAADATILPVKVTDEQHAKLKAFCEKRGIKPGTFIREAAFAELGIKLGVLAHRAELDALAKAVG